MAVKSLRWKIFILFLLAVFAAPCSVAAQVNLEYSVKAAFVLNFLRYVTFENANDPSRVILCVVGEDEALAAFAPLREKSVNELQIEIVENPRHAGECMALFVTAAAEEGSRKLIESVRGKGVLLIGESPGFAARGGCIELTEEGKRIRFSINLKTARSEKLSISSRLLQLAKVVDE